MSYLCTFDYCNPMAMDQPQRPMRRLFRYLRPYRGQLGRTSAASISNKILDLMPPFLTAWIIDTVSGNTPEWIAAYTGLQGPWPVLLFLGGLATLIFMLESLTEWMLKRGFLRLAQRVQHDLRVDAYDHLQEREMAFFERQRTGNLMSVLNDDINQLERFLNSSFNEILQLIILFFFAGWSLMWLSPTLGLLGMAPIPFIIWGSFIYQRRIAPYYQQVRQQVGELGNRLENNISGILVIKSFTAERFERGRVADASAAYRDANFRAIRWSSVYFPLIRLPIAFGFIGTLVIGAYWVLYQPERFTVGGLAFYAMMIQRLLWPVTRLGFIFDEYQRARSSARRVFGLLDSENTVKPPAVPRPLPQPPGDFRLQDVHFGYLPGQPILNGIDLTIGRGETLGIAGPTGSGKTTLIKLLLRLYDPDKGSISLGDVDLREADLQQLRRQIALVSQDVYLFHGSIAENLAYGSPQADAATLERAAQQAHLHDFIAGLPQGYETIVGERGIRLSGGQRQRLSLARAILKDAPVIILDEATSAVDTETERAIQEQLQLLTRDRTAIIIAHRLSTIRQADRIVVLNEGRIAETGAHNELISRNGVYAGLWRVQTGESISM